MYLTHLLHQEQLWYLLPLMEQRLAAVKDSLSKVGMQPGDELLLLRLAQGKLRCIKDGMRQQNEQQCFARLKGACSTSKI
jgi:hypothetical protein